MNPKGGVGVETERSGAEVPVRRVMPREREQEPRCWTFQSQTERRDRGQTEKSWLLFEGIDTFFVLRPNEKIENRRVLYDLTRDPGTLLLCSYSYAHPLLCR